MTPAAARPLREVRVVRVIARLNVGGPARHVILLDRGLRARGYRTLLLYGRPGPAEGALDHLAAEAGVPAARLDRLGPHIRPWQDLRALLAILRVLVRTRPDVVHTHTTKAGVLGRLAALLYNALRPRRARCVIMHTYHGTVFRGYFGRTASAAVRVVERILGAVTDRIAVLSDQQRQDVVETARVAPAARVQVVPLGLDLDPLLGIDAATPTLRGELGLTADAVVLGFVGRLVPIKDVGTLLRAFGLVRGGAPHAVLLVAGDGPLRPALAALAASLGVADAVRFLGWRRDLTALHATLDVVLLSSLNEGTPASVIEGMAAGRPVVATDVGGVADLVEHEATGLLVPPGRPDALAAAIARAAGDAAARRRWGAAGRRRAAARFTAARLVDDIDRLYRADLAAVRGAAAPAPGGAA